jgi:dUTP pyrophosphatase
MTTLKVYKTHPDIKLPTFATQQSACFDLSFNSAGKQGYEGYNGFNKKILRPFKDGNLYIHPKDRIMVPTGIILDIPEGYSVRLHPRSGLSLKSGIVLANAEGVIDSDYIQEVFVLLYNMSENGMMINNGDRVCQAELVKDEKYVIEETTTQPTTKTDRQGGFGSTGVQATEAPVKRRPGRPKTKKDPLPNTSTET